MLRVIRQRTGADCAIAALANLSPSLAYESLVAVGADVEPTWFGRRGFLNREVVALASRVGLMLQPCRAYDLDHDAGVLRLYYQRRDARAKASPYGHFVCVRGGLVLDPDDGSATPWRSYVDRHGVTLCTLLRLR